MKPQIRLLCACLGALLVGVTACDEQEGRDEFYDSSDSSTTPPDATQDTGQDSAHMPNVPRDTNNPVDTQWPRDTNNPVDTQWPHDTNNPVDTQWPSDTNGPVDTQWPSDTNGPVDCLGVPNGTAVLDVCGVCNGNGTSCLDCLGVSPTARLCWTSAGCATAMAPRATVAPARFAIASCGLTTKCGSGSTRAITTTNRCPRHPCPISPGTTRWRAWPCSGRSSATGRTMPGEPRIMPRWAARDMWAKTSRFDRAVPLLLRNPPPTKR